MAFPDIFQGEDDENLAFFMVRAPKQAGLMTTVKIYLITILFIILLPCSVSSQVIGKMQFRDFPVVQNLDSLERAIIMEQTNPGKYLIGLLTLEKSRLMLASYKFGNGLPIIKTLARQFQYPDITGTYLYFLGNLSKPPQERFKLISDALSFFEGQKDTTGMINCSGYLIGMNISGFSNVVGDLAGAEERLARIRDLDSRSQDVGDHLTVLRTSIYFYFHDLSKYADSTTACLQKAFDLIKLHPGVKSRHSSPLIPFQTDPSKHDVCPLLFGSLKTGFVHVVAVVKIPFKPWPFG